jgi:hypothetical protein
VVISKRIPALVVRQPKIGRTKEEMKRTDVEPAEMSPSAIVDRQPCHAVLLTFIHLVSPTRCPIPALDLCICTHRYVEEELFD